MMRVLLSALAVSLTLASCGGDVEQPAQQKQDKLKDLDWIVGNWEMVTPEGTVRESWFKDSDSSMHGMGLFTAPAGDTLYSENISLVQSGDTLFYIPAVSNQNDGKPVPFKEMKFSADEVIFENKAHDFPQRIVYKRTSDSTMNARVEGMQEGKARAEEFSYTRSK